MIRKVLSILLFILALGGIPKAHAACFGASPSGNGVFVVTNTAQICNPVNKGTWALVGTPPYTVYIYDNNTWNIVSTNPGLSSNAASTPASPVSGTVTVSLGSYSYINPVLNGNTTFLLDGTNAPANSANFMTLNICQDVAGFHTINYTVPLGQNLNLKATGGNQPVLSTGAGSCDYNFFVYDSASLTWIEWIPPVINNPVALAAIGTCGAGSYAQSLGSTGPTCNPIGFSNINAPSTGTTLNLVTKLNSSAQSVNMLTSDTSGAVGICTSNCGTSGNAFIQTSGTVGCTFDGSTLAGHYVTLSSTVAGNCHDAGSTPPASLNLGQVLSTNASAGTYTMLLLINQTTGSVGQNLTPKIIGGIGISTYNVLTTDNLLLVNNQVTAGDFTINLPSVASDPGQLLVIKRVDSVVFPVVIMPNGSDTTGGSTHGIWEGGGTSAGAQVAATGMSRTITNDGVSDWKIIAHSQDATTRYGRCIPAGDVPLTAGTANQQICSFRMGCLPYDPGVGNAYIQETLGQIFYTFSSAPSAILETLTENSSGTPHSDGHGFNSAVLSATSPGSLNPIGLVDSANSSTDPYAPWQTWCAQTNGQCTANLTPFSCCTGSGTGTCLGGVSVNISIEPFTNNITTKNGAGVSGNGADTAVLVTLQLAHGPTL